MKKFAVMAASLSAAALAGSLMTSAAAQTIKIGVIEPLTGAVRGLRQLRDQRREDRGR